MVLERRKTAVNYMFVPLDEVDVGFQGHKHYTGEEETSPKSDNSTEEPNAGKNLIRGLLDPNTYATKKTIAQGLLDVALLTANASQLKYLLQVGKQHEFYYLMLSLICISIILQIVIGIVIVVKVRYNINDEAQHRVADILNNVVVWLVFLVTVLNVFITAFGVEPGVLIVKYPPTIPPK